MKKIILIVFAVFISTFATTILLANEVTDLKVKKVSPFENRIYLVDSNKEISTGYFSIRTEKPFKDKDFKVPGLMMYPTVIENNLDDKFQDIELDLATMLSLNLYYNTYVSFMISSITAGSLGLIMAATSLSLGFTTSFPLHIGVGMFAGGSFHALISLVVLLPICLVFFTKYNKMKKTILNTLNGIPVSYNDREVLRVKFDLRIL